MRLLFTCIRSSSHLRTLVPVAAAARAAGHAAVLAGPPAMAAEVAEYGIAFRPAGADWELDPAVAETMGRQLAFHDHDGYTSTLIDHAFLGDTAVRAGRDLVALAGEWRPDVVVRVAEEFGGYLAAEALGLPHAAVASGCTHLLGPAAVRTRLRRLRARFGLPDVPDPDPYPLLASFVPPRYDGDRLPPATLRHFRHESARRHGERLPAWLAELPTDRPLVYAAFGSVLPDLRWHAEPLVSAVVAALRELDCAAVVAAGASAAALPADLPPSIRVVDAVPQPLLLEVADLFVTHAGFASVREALRTGTPMVALPVIGDEPHHADRCAELGVAYPVPAGRAGAATIRRACAEVLADARYRRAAREVRQEILALPDLTDLVGALERLSARSGLAVATFRR